MDFREVTRPGIYGFYYKDSGNLNWFRKFDGVDWYTGEASSYAAMHVLKKADARRKEGWADLDDICKPAVNLDGSPWTEAPPHTPTQLELF